MNSPEEILLNKVGKQGWKAGIVPVSHLAELQQMILGFYNKRLINKMFYRDQLNFFSFKLPDNLPNARSIIIVAIPTPQIQITFHWKGKRIPVTVPPTYVSYIQRSDYVREILSGILRHEGYRLAKAVLPLKTLAVRSGLAEYGRNNICYVPGMGSFLQLVGVFTDMPCDADPWREPKLMDRCESCYACLQHCPTGAITDKRILLRAERCLTYHNEAAGKFPDWINPSWHHCLIGCMKCQTACPENKAVKEWSKEHAVFSDDETSLFIRRVPFDLHPDKMMAKVRNLEINEDYRFLCRNLSMIIGK